MKKHLPIKTIITSSIFLSLLGGCASPPAKSKVPAKLEREIKAIEGVKPSTTYQPSVSDEKTIYVVKKGDTLWSISRSYGVPVETISRTNYITNTKDLKVGQKLVIASSGKTYASSYAGYTPARNIKGGVSPKGFIWPVKGQIVSQFGALRNGVKNMGIYILPEQGQEVVAAKKGAVEAVTYTRDGKVVVVIKHDGGVRTIYGCCSSSLVEEGSYVEQGQPVVSVNPINAGNASEINFKIYVKDKPVNPLSYLP